MTMPHDLPSQIAALHYRIAEIERRARNARRTGTIAEIGSGENAGKYRVKLSAPNGAEYLTPWSQSRTLGAGGVKIDVLYSVGQQVDVTSENGDMTDAMIDMSSYSEANARANANMPLHIKIGDRVFAMSGDGIAIVGDVVITGTLTVNEGTVINNGTDIGGTHRHTNVLPGAGLSGPPEG